MDLENSAKSLLFPIPSTLYMKIDRSEKAIDFGLLTSVGKFDLGLDFEKVIKFGTDCRYYEVPGVLMMMSFRPDRRG